MCSEVKITYAVGKEFEGILPPPNKHIICFFSLSVFSLLLSSFFDFFFLLSFTCAWSFFPSLNATTNENLRWAKQYFPFWMKLRRMTWNYIDEIVHLFNFFFSKVEVHIWSTCILLLENVEQIALYTQAADRWVATKKRAKNSTEFLPMFLSKIQVVNILEMYEILWNVLYVQYVY